MLNLLLGQATRLQWPGTEQQVWDARNARGAFLISWTNGVARAIMTFHFKAAIELTLWRGLHILSANTSNNMASWNFHWALLFSQITSRGSFHRSTGMSLYSHPAQKTGLSLYLQSHNLLAAPSHGSLYTLPGPFAVENKKQNQCKNPPLWQQAANT